MKLLSDWKRLSITYCFLRKKRKSASITNVFLFTVTQESQNTNVFDSLFLPNVNNIDGNEWFWVLILVNQCVYE